MRRMRFIHVVLVVIIAFSLSSCSTTVEIQGDARPYDSAELVDAATLIVEGKVVDAQPTVLMPRFESSGDSPEENPYLGVPEHELREAIESAEGLPGTEVTFHIDLVHRGAAESGEEITIVQVGGEIDGISYVVEGEHELVPGDTYLLFMRDGFDDTFLILGGSAGTYRPSETGEFIPAQPETAPFDRLDSEALTALIEQ